MVVFLGFSSLRSSLLEFSKKRKGKSEKRREDERGPRRTFLFGLVLVLFFCWDILTDCREKIKRLLLPGPCFLLLFLP